MKYLDHSGVVYLWSKIKSLVSGYLPLSGGKLTGNLTGQYITGTWLQGSASNHSANKQDRVVVQDSSGWLYHRTLAELRSDILSNMSVTLTSSGWTLSGGVYVQTISVSGVTTNSVLIVASAPSNSKVYGECGVKCVSQTAGKLTFNADNKPSVNLTANIVNLGEET